VVQALDSGLAVVCDPDPLTAQGEALCLVAGRRTYAWWHGRCLYHRARLHISAGIDDAIDVLASHECNVPIPFVLLDKERMRKRYRPHVELPDSPPF